MAFEKTGREGLGDNAQPDPEPQRPEPVEDEAPHSNGLDADDD